MEITFRIKEFCSSRSTSDFLLCEMSIVLRGLFFLMISCLFGCFDRILALSAEDRCHLMSVRGTGNFDILFISSGNRHKFTSMFNCASLVQNFLINFSPTLQSPNRWHIKGADPHQKSAPFTSKVFCVYCNVPYRS